MTTLTETVPNARPATRADFIDRWIYVFTAALFVVAVLIGFIPDSLQRIADVESGRRPPFPLILHAHAVLMGAWLIVLLAQTALMATRRRTLHQKFGLVAFVLAPALVIVGFWLAPTMRLETANAMLHGPPDLVARLRPRFEFALDILLVQMRIGILFAVLIAIGLWARRRDSALHKRLMILGTAAPLPAALDRMQWLPSTLPDNPLTAELYPLVLIAPMFAWDLFRLGKVHLAYWLYLGGSLMLAIPTHLLWGTPWWRETALRLFGITGL